MRLERVDGSDARAVLRALRGAVLGAGPAIALDAGSAIARGAGPAHGVGVTTALTRAPHDDRADAPQGTDSAQRPSPAGFSAEMPPGTAIVVTTSGSTGYPKAVALSRSALTASALATSARIGEGAWLLALPAHYIAGIQVLVRSLIAGREPAILSGSFSPTAFAAAAHGMASSVGGTRVPTFTALVPTQVQTLLDAGVHDALASFDTVLVGGQALAPALAERAAAAGVRIVRTYGSTETAGGCVYDGLPLDGTGVRVVDGEVWLSGPTLADEYVGEPERTASVFVTDEAGTRWYRTGDAGSFDGVLRITGRLDNVLVSGGINVSLDRVEQVVRSVAGLAEAVVVAVPDERWGEASVILVPHGAATRGRSPRDPLSADTADEALLQAARGMVGAELGAPARPARLVRIDRIPLLPSGKPDRRALRALAAGPAAPPTGS